MMMKRTTLQMIVATGILLGAPFTHAALLHYSVNDTDAATVAGGTVPGIDGSANGVVTGAGVTLSTNVPTVGVPAGAGNRSLNFNGAGGVNLPGTQQLLNSTIAANGGFTYEAWFSYSGGGNINSIIDYAGTEKLVREAAGGITGYRNNSGAPLHVLGADATLEWHYAAVVFTPTGPVDGSGGITGDLTLYYDSAVSALSVGSVTITNFGDSLNRTIAVGGHPQGFAGDWFNGQIYEPRVSLGALSAGELLYTIPEPSGAALAGIGMLVLLARRRR